MCESMSAVVRVCVSATSSYGTRHAQKMQISLTGGQGTDKGLAATLQA